MSALGVQSAFMAKLGSSFRSENSGAWLRFLVAAVGLTLAFAAAIFSTAARDAGNVIGTVILATLALLLAVGVGLGTVPYLARRVGARRVRDALDFEVTKAGVLYALVILLIGVAALNTGNNLLYIVVAVMLSAIAVSGVASALCLRDLELDLRVPDHIFAGTEVAATVRVSNSRRWIPSLSISAVPIEKKTQKKRWQWVSTTFSIPPWRPPEQQWLRLPDRKLRRVAIGAPSGVFHEAAYFPIVPAGSALEASVKLNFRRRGCYQERFSLSTRFPFAFLVKTRRAALSREVLVYPELTSSEEAIELVPLFSGKFEAYLRGIGSDLYRIREYLPEDPARQVDWKATAKSGSLKVREFAREDERRIRIVFDNPVPGALQSPRYERMVSLTASLVWRLAEQNVFISFVSQDYESFGDVFGILRYLATVGSKAGPSLLETLSACTDYSIVFTTQKRGTIPAGAWATSYFVFLE
ncbi:MAG TPA: DUF58 domain-containing protein [Terriglobales bacterium]|nr:DUF58 domain-containing protein [Terriglobales bacterium]